MSTAGETPTSTEDAPSVAPRKQPFGAGFLNTIGRDWQERPAPEISARKAASFAAARREALAGAFPNARIVIAAGDVKVRSNDTDYPFRADTAFTHLTGWGSDAQPDSVLVVDATVSPAESTLYFRERADRTTDEFYSNAAIGEFWTGPRPSKEEVAADLQVRTAGLHEFSPLDSDLTPETTPELLRYLGESRLVKDAYEIEQMRRAVDVTAKGFDDIIEHLATAANHPRGERVVESVFHQRARTDGNWEGYDTIAAAGPHATYLHWTRNDGAVRHGELILVDAGVELDSLYTADITRTLPVSGTFDPVQRKVYQAVLDAADAAFAIVKPGIRFREVHEAAMAVIAQRVEEWGLLPVTAQEALDADRGGQHRRYMVHGTSHHLGIDVHDCAGARREMYYDGIVEEGMVFTIEPGLYFQIDDLTVPEAYRGIGVRIEDDILVTADGAENLSAGIPRTPDDVEAWVSSLTR